MGEPQFTPGPWDTPQHRSEDVCVKAGEELVALVYSTECNDGVSNLEANRRLIAAAPALYEGGRALDQLVEEMQVNVAAYLEPGINFDAGALINKLIYLLDGPEQREAQGKLRAALSLALGEKQDA